MKHLFIINPATGDHDRTQEYTQAIDRVCREKEMDYRIEVSQAPGECTRLAREAAETGEEYRIYACGGDGTLNEVVAGAVGHPNVAVTVYSGGSGNDFVKLFDDPKAFFDLERLVNAREMEVDLIRCNDDISLNICSVGLDARIGTDVASYKRLPLLHGFRAYVVSTLINVIRGISEHYVVEIGGERIDRRLTMISVCNGQYYGGGFHPVPQADPTDGQLEVLLVEHVSRLQVPMVIGKYKNGQYAQLPKLVRHFRTDSLRIICDKPTPVSLDGELRTAQTVEISLAKEKLRFFYPEGLRMKVKEPVTV